jgi:hypothetical protein
MDADSFHNPSDTDNGLISYYLVYVLSSPFTVNFSWEKKFIAARKNIFSDFTEEYKKALDWLNDHTCTSLK